MKQRNLILTIVFVAGLSTNLRAMAQEDPTTEAATTEVAADTEAQENAKLDEIHALLKQLADAKAMELDDAGSIRVKQSVFEQLRNKGRLSTLEVGSGSICN